AVKAAERRPDPIKREPSAKKPPKPTEIDLGRMTIQGGVVRMTRLYKGGRQDLTEISDFGLNVANVKNGGTGSAEITGKVRMDNNPPAPGTTGQLAANLNGKFDFTLSKDLKPEVLKGGAQAVVQNATGGMAELAGL